MIFWEAGLGISLAEGVSLEDLEQGDSDDLRRLRLLTCGTTCLSSFSEFSPPTFAPSSLISSISAGGRAGTGVGDRETRLAAMFFADSSSNSSAGSVSS